MENKTNIPLLSIIIPVFNRQEKLNNLLEVIDNEIFIHNKKNKIEVIVIDDFSNKIIKLNKLNIDVTLKRNTSNLGAPISRMIGSKISKGKFIHFHDSDDSFGNNYLMEIFAVLTEKPLLDILLTGRIDIDNATENDRYQNYFHKLSNNKFKISKRLIYRNCLGPLGGVTFSRRIIEKADFKDLASCQDWQMYLDVVEHAKVLVSRPDIKFIFNKTGDDRISHNPRKKILGHLQLARITGKKSPFGRNIRLFYLYTCKQHIFNKGGQVLKFYKKNRLSIILSFLVISVYWRMT